MYYQRKRWNKFSNKKTEYNGIYYDSIKEADYARELDLRVKAGELTHWERQVPIDLVVNGQKVCTYKIDFVEYWTNGSIVYVEIKGFETPEWKLKWKLFDALEPELEKVVIK